MRCGACGTENPDGAKFCMDCGARLARVCPECGTELPAGAKFCFECGAQVGAAPVEARGEPAAPDAIPGRIRRLIPQEYVDRLLAASGQMAGERRLVTILFSDVKGSTAMAERLDPEEVMEIMDGAFDVLIEPVMRYEGTLARLMGDAILAFFGAPIAHEDDPERACRAALEIVDGARAYAERLERERGIEGFNVRVGINTGLVVVGEVGSDLRVEYTAMGDAINLAARMEQNAPPGGILITHDTYRHVRGVFDVLRQEPLRVKGKTEPVRAYLVQGAKPRAFRKGVRGVEGIETRMIGRQAQLTTLQEAFLTAVEDRELQMVTVVGDAGVGKSRLLHEFDNWSELLPETFYYFRGRALQAMQGLPYSLLRSLFTFRFQIDDTDPVEMVRHKLESGICAGLGEGEEGRAAAHLIGHLVGFELSGSPHLEPTVGDPRQTRDRALGLISDYFKALASQNPVLVLLEDLHWADNSSLDALNHLALRLAHEPVMILCAARPELFERRPHWGEGQAFHRRLPLEPLTKHNTRRLLDEILQKVQGVPDTLSELVVAGAEGNPFFVEELVKMLVEDGVILKGEEHWRVEPARLNEVRVPPTLRGVLQARLDRLPVQDRTVLQQASVVGRQFWDRAVVHISESSSESVQEEEVLEALAALRGREMVFQREITTFAGAEEYVFKHNVLREVTYDSLLKRLRRVYHGVVADWLMEQAGERAGEYTALIADHLEHAGRAEEAAKYLVDAGDRARGLYAHQEAVGAYQRALALLKQLGDLAGASGVLMKLGLAHHSAFDFAKSRQAYEEAFSLQQVTGKAGMAGVWTAPHVLRGAFLPPPTLDPTLANDLDSAVFIDQLFSGLLELTPELDVVPGVARRWEVLDDGRRYVFHLRDDVRWSDGVPVTAADFEFAWKRVLDPATSSRNASLLYCIDGACEFHQGRLTDPDKVGVQALDDLTLEVRLERRTGYFLYLLSHMATYPVPRHAVRSHGEAWSQPDNIVTNGPFRIEAWSEGAVVLERGPDYHGRFTGNLGQVRLSLLPTAEWAGALAMYEADEVDFLSLHEAPVAWRERVREAFPDECVLVPEGKVFYIVFDVTRAPFRDRRVRRAFAHALDRHALVRDERGGIAVAATGGLVPQGMPGHTPGVGLPYDPDRARQLLAEAGFPGGEGFPRQELLTSARFDAATRNLLTQWSEELGVDLSIETVVEWADYLKVVDEHPPPLFMMGWVADYPDPDSYLRVPIRQQTRWHHPTYDQLIDRAMQVTDQDERMHMYSQADRILVHEAAVVPLSYAQAPLLLKTWVREYPVHALSYWAWKDVIIDPH